LFFFAFFGGEAAAGADPADALGTNSVADGTHSKAIAIKSVLRQSFLKIFLLHSSRPAGDGT